MAAGAAPVQERQLLSDTELCSKNLISGAARLGLHGWESLCHFLTATWSEAACLIPAGTATARKPKTLLPANGQTYGEFHFP